MPQKTPQPAVSLPVIATDVGGPQCPTAPLPWELLPPSQASPRASGRPLLATEPFFTMGHSLQGRGYWKDLKK